MHFDCSYLLQHPQDTAELVYQAIKSGVRHFDCACDYGNEVEVGAGLNRAMTDGLCSRADLWVSILLDVTASYS